MLQGYVGVLLETELESPVKDPGFLPAPADQLWAAGKVNPKSIMVGQSKGEDAVFNCD